ncbi:gram-negative porin family protein [Ralstonia insidiosa]|uniref:Gram-negative porin family protein n=1 Tax=Ralstonia insidiosa TaxID=190721 RepID=A0AAC9BJG4_9RALS|nr:MULTISPECIES: porin [Ralstonia]ANH75045.1 gram-negative porin family protein [Ralstonia insidiosa]MBY4703933.1 porin [Ralstonia insidiosa]
MKRKLATILVLASGTTAAIAEPKINFGDAASLEIYGRVQVGLEYLHTGTTYIPDNTFSPNQGNPVLDDNGRFISTNTPSHFRLRNQRSVIGFRGDVKINDDLKAVWQIESSAAADGGGGLHVPVQTWANRDSGVGIESQTFGRIIFGSWQTPYTHATFGYDPYYTTTGAYMGIMGNGSGASSDPISDPATFDRREHNLIQYWSPDINGFKMRLGFEVNEFKTGQQNANPALNIAAAPAQNPYMVSLETTYDKGPLNVTFASEAHHQYQVGGGTDLGVKFGAAYWFHNTTRLAGIVQRLHYKAADGDLAQNQYYLSLIHKFTAQDQFKLGYAVGSQVSGSSKQIIGYLRAGPESASKILTIGVEHQFNKYFALLTYWSKTFNQANAFMDFPINDTAPAMGTSPSVFALLGRFSF